MLSVSLDANGWTVVTPPSGARVIYCSSSTGNDSNDGLSPNDPVQTLTQGIGLLRDHSADQLLLKRGDTWNSDLGVWRKSGKSADQPMLVGAYGAGDRPLLLTGTEPGFDAIASSNPEIDNIAIVGIHFESNGRDPTSPAFVGPVNVTGINFLTKTTDLLIEDCQIEGYAENINVQAFYGPIHDVQIRRNIIDNAYATTSYSQGLYAYGVTNLLIEGNLFDHNGYNDAVPGGQATYYNQDCYLASDNTNCTVRDNIFANAAGYGLQARAGGDIEDNLFIDNPVGLSYGLVNGAHVAPGGVTGVVNGNVFIGGANIGNAQGGSGLQIANTRPGYPTVVSNNIFADGVANTPAAITLTFGAGQSNPQDAAGLNDLLVENNIIDNWYRGIYVDGGFQPGSSGPQGINDVQIRQNDFQHVTGPVLTHSDPMYKTQEHWSDNRYSADSNSLQVAQKTMSLSQWQNADEPSAIVADVAYGDPNAAIAAYNAAAGGQPTIDDFLAQARLQSSQIWRGQYDAESVIAYFRNAYAEVGASPRDWRAPTPPIATAALPQTVLDNSGSMTFTVTYQDLKALNLSSLASGNLNVTGKRGLNVPAALVNVSGGGASATATYSIAVPSRYFRKGQPQKLTVVMNGAQVDNAEGFSVPAGTIGTFKIRVLPAPKPPVVKNVKPTGGGKALAVRFSQDVGASIAAGELVLQSDNGQTIDPTSMSVTWDSSHNTATWTFPGAAEGALPAGRWTVRLSGADIVNATGLHLDGNHDGVGGDDYLAKKPLVVKSTTHSSRQR